MDWSALFVSVDIQYNIIGFLYVLVNDRTLTASSWNCVCVQSERNRSA